MRSAAPGTSSLPGCDAGHRRRIHLQLVVAGGWIEGRRLSRALGEHDGDRAVHGIAMSLERLLAITLHASEIAALPLAWPVMPAPVVGRAALIGASIQGTFLYADLYREGRV